ncbi:isoprenoid synthase domain-containing protein [Glomus cerebriforme]|uniref:Isoprenoid synthase domain-containing protein n=1 Tax=Glomus cerebriforme TaxID=658196 RepID=A0A397SMG4_9GLOM|nr:isoprenoid synthase domain-containing protein [Glomus cerebriforme]
MIRESVSNPQFGKIRMEFWRETIDNIFKGNPPQQPIAQVLYNSLKMCQLPSLFFKRIIDERDAQLSDPPYITNKDLESYGENTASCLLYLHLKSLGVEDIQADHAASHIGKSIGIVTILKGFPYLVSKRRMLLPSVITAKYNISQEEIFRKGPVKGLDDAIFEIATLAHDHLLTARTFLQNIPNQALPALLSAVPCDSYLKRLEKYNFNIFEPKLAIRNWKLPFSLWYNYNKGTF